MTMLPQRDDRYLRWPRFERNRADVWLHLLQWEPGRGESHLTVELTAEGVPESERAQPLPEGTLGWEPGRPPKPTGELAAVADVARDEEWSVRVDRAGYVSSVVATDPRGVDHLVWSASATAAAPAIVAAADGAWVAFHHNLREDKGEIDLAKWVAVRRVMDDGRVLEPTAAMRDRDRDRLGEEQSFEFPAIAVSKTGSVALLGRGSHCIYRQDLSADGWGPRVPLDDGTWGCRGMHLDAVTQADGSMLFAWRGRKGIEIRHLLGPPIGAPDLQPAEVQPPSTVAVGVSPRRDRDPAARDGRTTLFGDIQQHSAHSDGLGSADEPYLRARHVYRDDFCALTDHESFLGKRTSPSEWAYLQAVAEAHNRDGFATLVAYEWTGKPYPGPGHKCVYLPTVGSPIISRDEVPVGKELVARIKTQGAITGPHHTGWTGADLEGHDPMGQPFWEICSCHGCYEHADHPLGQRGELYDQMVDAALAKGLRFGFIANSDGHGLLWHHGEARKRDPFRTGLTAVQAATRSRAGILAALRERRCYATSGVPILLDLRVGDAPMGSEVDAAEGTPVTAVAIGTDAVRILEVVADSGVVASVEGHANDADLRWYLRGTPRFVYARVVQHDGEMAWTSPVFFGPAAAAPTGDRSGAAL